MSRTNACRDCGESIQFEKQHGKWVPLDPATHQRHRCKLNQHCGTCGGTFQGSPWMKKCPQCFQDSRNTTEKFNRTRTGIEGAVEYGRDREKLNEGNDDGNPF